jgi:hypothetical protein
MRFKVSLSFFFVCWLIYAQEGTVDKQISNDDDLEKKSENIVVPELHIHDDFYFRFFNNFALGYGYVSGQETPIDISNISVSGSVQFGYAIVKDWIPYISFDYNVTPAHILLLSLFPGNVSGANFPDYPEHAMVMTYSLGMTHYFMPQNYYISLSVGLAQAAVLNDSDPDNVFTSETDFGVSFKLAFGKEWWMSTNWALGLAVYTEYNYFDQTKSGQVITPLNAFSIGIAASATFN